MYPSAPPDVLQKEFVRLDAEAARAAAVAESWRAAAAKMKAETKAWIDTRYEAYVQAARQKAAAEKAAWEKAEAAAAQAAVAQAQSGGDGRGALFGTGSSGGSLGSLVKLLNTLGNKKVVKGDATVTCEPASVVLDGTITVTVQVTAPGTQTPNHVLFIGLKDGLMPADLIQLWCGWRLGWSRCNRGHSLCKG